MRSFLANYSGNLQAALILWPMASAFLTLPILAYLYHRDGRLRAGSVAAVYLAVLYVLGIGCFTLWPLPDGDAGPGITYGVSANFNPFAFVGDIAKDGLKAVLQIAFNVVFFMPLGFIAGRLLRMKALPAVALALGVSAMVELAQYTGLFGIYPYAYRCCDVDDLAANTLGGWLGWLAAAWLNKAVPQKLETVEVSTRPGFVRRCVALWIDLSLAGLATLFVYLGATLWARLVLRHAFGMLGMDEPATSQALLVAILVASFLAVEVAVPWLWEGKTPGGAFVRMTCESHPRPFGRRIAFYAARTAVIACALVAPWFAFPVLGVFYLAKRKMPYDCIP